MNDYVLVLNAGSSSLKFSVYMRPEGGDWRPQSRGQIEGIGTAPRFFAKDASSAVIAKENLGDAVCDAQSALESLADWLRDRYGGGRILGVGHRVVHGGAQFTANEPNSNTATRLARSMRGACASSANCHHSSLAYGTCR